MKLAGALALLACCAATAFAQQRGDELKPYIACDFDDGLRIASTMRLPVEMRSRSVRTATGSKSVSIVDGYRLVLAYPGTDPFVNLRAEMSGAERYASDKTAVIAQMHHIAAAGGGTPAPVRHDTYAGFDHYALDDLTLAHSPIALHTFFRDDRRLVLTLYFLNAPPERRKYSSLDEFRALRDHFLQRYFECVRRNGG